MTRTAHLCRTLGLTLAIGLLAACGQDAPSGITGMSAAAAAHDRVGLGGASAGLDQFKPAVRDVENMTAGNWQQVFKTATCSPHGAISASGVFGPAGGTLTFGGSRLIIPGGALRDTVTISATIPEGSSSSVEFAPHGLQFLKSAGLVLSTVSCELANPLAPAVVYLAPDGTVLEYIEAVYDPRWRTIAAPIDHFSGYAIAF